MSLFYDPSKPINLTFITLSLWTNEKHYNVTKARELLVKPFLNRIQEKINMKTYLVKEHLDYKKRLHFNVTTNTYVPETIIISTWTNLLYNEGLIVKWTANNLGKLPICTQVEYSN